MCTGSGKTRVGVLAALEVLKKHPDSKVLVIVPTTNLRDNEWVREFERWAPEIPKEKVRMECIHSVYKDTSSIEEDMIILDEVHKMLSPQFSSILKVESPFFLALTATLPLIGETENDETLLELLDKAPVSFNLPIQEATELGIVSPYEIINIPVRLTRKESTKYDVFTKMLQNAAGELKVYARELRSSAFEVAMKYSKVIHEEDEKHQASKAFVTGMTMRRQVCAKANSKIEAAIDIIKMMQDRKIIIFASSISSIEELHKRLLIERVNAVKFHSKMSKKDKEEALRLAALDEVQVICSAEALIAGYDLPNIDFAICLSGNSKRIPAQQMLGRICRFKFYKRAIFVNLYAANTVEKSWVEKRSKDLPTKFLNLDEFMEHALKKTDVT